MKIYFNTLQLSLKQEEVSIDFKDFNYFFGRMGAGKSSIARLIDFCLGGNPDRLLTPALQSEFVAAKLTLQVSDSIVELERSIKSSQVRGRFPFKGNDYEVMIPTRRAEGEVLQGSGIEVISDLLFVLSDKKPPKVKRSQKREGAGQSRLSFRDLNWYCYLDQETIDSSFFHLDGDVGRRNKSRDVLRFIIGFHQEEVSDLETRLEETRRKRESSRVAYLTLRESLKVAKLETGDEIELKRERLQRDLLNIESEITQIRSQSQKLRPHAVDELQKRARAIAADIGVLDVAIQDLHNSISQDIAHKNEVISLSTRFKRATSARAVLEGVEFSSCPRCNQELQVQELGHCRLCGQHEPNDEGLSIGSDEIEQDAKVRIKELDEIIKEKQGGLDNLAKQKELQSATKRNIDEELDRVLANYDSAYLSSALEFERRRAATEQQLLELDKIGVLVGELAELDRRVHELVGEEAEIRSELKDKRELAEKDTHNLDRLDELFLDCLLRSEIPGFALNDTVEISSPHFLPEIINERSGGLTVTSYSNLGSGGVKTLFKACFAIAIHRLAAEIGAFLPTFLIIDSPMKNVSERQNRKQFEEFHQMLYELAETELLGTQFILIDKEFLPAPNEFKPSFSSRFMMPDDDVNVPLIPYYREHDN